MLSFSKPFEEPSTFPSNEIGAIVEIQIKQLIYSELLGIAKIIRRYNKRKKVYQIQWKRKECFYHSVVNRSAIEIIWLLRPRSDCQPEIVSHEFYILVESKCSVTKNKYLTPRKSTRADRFWNSLNLNKTQLKSPPFSYYV